MSLSWSDGRVDDPMVVGPLAIGRPIARPVAPRDRDLLCVYRVRE